jgi:hypothetical protein
MIRPAIHGVSRAYAFGGRLLLLFTAVLIFVMPWTEHFCQLDKFLRGGQDCELGLLALLTIFALILVLLKQRRQSLNLLLVVQRWLSAIFKMADPQAVLKACGSIVHSNTGSFFGCVLRQYNLPIQI